VEFISKQMLDSNKYLSLPHILSVQKRAVKFSGRESAISQAATKFNIFKDPFGTSKEDRKIPVASGLSGLGKTRLLEEWEDIFNLAEIPQPRCGILIPYYNGHNPQPVEGSMSIEASFSWRLLHRVFIEGNGKAFCPWFKNCLPMNAGALDLRTTLEVIIIITCRQFE
jgi:hypothetical protein